MGKQLDLLSKVTDEELHGQFAILESEDKLKNKQKKKALSKGGKTVLQ